MSWKFWRTGDPKFDDYKKRHATVPWPFRRSFEKRFGTLAKAHDDAYDEAAKRPTQGLRFDGRLDADRVMLLGMRDLKEISWVFKLYYKVTPFFFKLNSAFLNWRGK